MNIDHALRQLTVLCPLFPKPLEGAKPDEIEALEALVQRPLPHSYRRFLEVFGRQDGGLTEGLGIDFDIDSLTAHYRDGMWGVEPPLLLIGVCSPDDISVVPICLAGDDLTDPRVVAPVLRSGRQHSVSECAATLGEYVFRLGFSQFFAYRLPFEGNAQVLEASTEKVAKVESVLASEGLVRHPASEGYAAYFIRPDLVVDTLQLPDGDRIALNAHGDEAAVQALLDKLEQEVGSWTWGLQPTLDAHTYLTRADD